MAAISNQRTTPLLIILVVLLLGYMGYSGTGLEMLGISGITQAKDTIAARKKTIDSLVVLTDSAKKILAQGSVDDLRRRLEGYRSSLELMRRLVPDRNEVANLMERVALLSSDPTVTADALGLTAVAPAKAAAAPTTPAGSPSSLDDAVRDRVTRLARVAGLRDGRHVGHERGALGSGGGDCLRLAGADLRDGRDRCGEK